MFELRIYTNLQGKAPFTTWLNKLRDPRARATIRARLIQVEAGNIGDLKALRNGVQELRIHYGPGYRVYLSRQGDRVILLLCGSDKSHQSRSIELAIAYLNDWKLR